MRIVAYSTTFIEQTTAIGVIPAMRPMCPSMRRANAEEELRIRGHCFLCQKGCHLNTDVMKSDLA